MAAQICRASCAAAAIWSTGAFVDGTASTLPSPVTRRNWRRRHVSIHRLRATTESQARHSSSRRALGGYWYARRSAVDAISSASSLDAPRLRTKRSRRSRCVSTRRSKTASLNVVRSCARLASTSLTLGATRDRRSPGRVVGAAILARPLRANHSKGGRDCVRAMRPLCRCIGFATSGESAADPPWIPHHRQRRQTLVRRIRVRARARSRTGAMPARRAVRRWWSSRSSCRSSPSRSSRVSRSAWGSSPTRTWHPRQTQEPARQL